MEDNHGATTRVAIIIDYYGDFFRFYLFYTCVKNIQKAGFDWKMAVCLTIPGFNVVAWLALAFMDWPIHKYLPKDVNRKDAK